MAQAPKSQACPGCKARYKTASMKVGARFRCVKCKEIVTVGKGPVPTQRPSRPASSVGPHPTAKGSQVGSGAQARGTNSSFGPQGSASGIGPSSLFSIPNQGGINLLDETGSTEDLASALVASATGKNRAVTPADLAPKAPPAEAGSAPAAPPANPNLPQVPGYRVDGVIAKGGMATVFKGVQESLGREVAIKILDPDLAKNPEGVARFKKEAAVLSALSHASIVSIIDAGQDGPMVYLVMEYVPGATLRYLLSNVKVSMKILLRYLEQVLEALSYAHEKGVIHRDVKPENIMVGPDERIKLADFGIAGLTAESFGLEIAGFTQGMTKTNAALGTAQYIAPEQLKNARDAGPRADLYSVGVILYEILTGEVPVGAFDPPSRRNPNVPQAIDDVVMRALKPNPELRFESAQEMLRALKDGLSTSGPKPPAPAPEAAQASSGAPGAAPAGGLSGLVSDLPPTPSLPPPSPSTSAPPSPRSQGAQALSREAAEALARERQRKQEEATWQAWQQGQEQAQTYRDESSSRLKKKDSSSPAIQVSKKPKSRAEEDAKARAAWDAKLNKEKKARSNWLQNLKGGVSALLGVLALISLLGVQHRIPILRDIPPLLALCDWMSHLWIGLQRSLGG